MSTARHGENSWHMLVVSVSPDDAEFASDVLWRAGVVAIEERQAVHSDASGEEVVELWTSVGDDIDGVIALLNHEQVSCSTRVELVARAVADTWREHAECVSVTDTVAICPSWQPHDHRPEVVVIRVDPHDMFGLGNHPTTRLALQLGLRHCATEATVVDVGCGSGILAITMCVVHQARCCGFDIHPSTVAVVHSNAALNDCQVEVVADSSEVPDGSAQLVLANILAPVLIDVAADIGRMSADEAVVVLSGLRGDQRERVLDAYKGWSVIDDVEEDGWLALALSRQH